MNIRPRPGELVLRDNSTIPQLRPVSQAPFLASGELCPDGCPRAGLGQTEEHPNHA
jgi:hypothetical protein